MFLFSLKEFTKSVVKVFEKKSNHGIVSKYFLTLWPKETLIFYSLSVFPSPTNENVNF